MSEMDGLAALNALLERQAEMLAELRDRVAELERLEEVGQSLETVDIPTFTALNVGTAGMAAARQVAITLGVVKDDTNERATGLLIKSDDALADTLMIFLGIEVDPTAGNRAGFIQAIEQNVAFRTLKLNPYGANTLVGGNLLASAGSLLLGASTNGTPKFIDSDGANFALASANQAQPFGSSANFSGVFLVNDLTTGSLGVFIQGGGAIVMLAVSQAGTMAVTSTPGATQLGVYLDGSNIVSIKNGYAVSHTLTVMGWRTRAAA